MSLGPFKRWTTSAAATLLIVLPDIYPAFGADSVPIPSAVDVVLEQSHPFSTDHSSSTGHALSTGHAFSISGPNNNPQAKTGTVEQTIVVLANEYAFVPNVIEAPANQPFVIELRNQGREAHNITFKKLDFKTETVESGQTAKLVVNQPLAKGRYPFYCSVGDHAKRGMLGVLVVYN